MNNTPKTRDYSKTIMYKLCCNDYNVKKIYIGHTICWRNRKADHKRSCNNLENMSYNYVYIRENGGWENWSMVMIEKYPCKNKREAEKRERELYDSYNETINTNKPYITEEERIIRDKNNSCKYRLNNPEKVNKYQYEEKICDICGKTTNNKHYSRHKKSKYCLSFLKVNL